MVTHSRQSAAQAIDDWSYQLKSVGPASGGRAGSITWTAPTGTAIRSFYLDHDSRTADKHYAEIHVLDGNGGDTNIYRAPNAPGGFVRYWRTGLLHRAVRVLLFCSDSGGCVRSDAAHSFVRNVELELADVANPSFYSVSGSLIDGGWKRGTHDFAAQTGDVGSGVRRLDVVVNGSPLGLRSGVDCRGQRPPYTAYKRPCGGAAFDINASTAFGPFRNGVNNVEIVLDDFAGNHRSATFRVLVDNAPPSLAFADAQDPNDPELIRAPVSDEHSGLASAQIFMRRVGTTDWLPLETRLLPGELRARVDSLSVPAGEYEFRATARDAGRQRGGDVGTRQWPADAALVPASGRRRAPGEPRPRWLAWSDCFLRQRRRGRRTAARWPWRAACRQAGNGGRALRRRRPDPRAGQPGEDRARRPLGIGDSGRADAPGRGELRRHAAVSTERSLRRQVHRAERRDLQQLRARSSTRAAR